MRERGSDLAGSLEGKAKDFLNDVKPKKKPLIPHYESDDDDGSSYVPSDHEDESWGSDWEEWYDTEEPEAEKVPEPPPTPLPTSTASAVATAVPLAAPASPEGAAAIANITLGKSPVPKEPELTVKPVPSFIESTAASSQLLKFPTLPVNIPEAFDVPSKSGEKRAKRISITGDSKKPDVSAAKSPATKETSDKTPPSGSPGTTVQQALSDSGKIESIRYGCEHKNTQECTIEEKCLQQHSSESNQLRKSLEEKLDYKSTSKQQISNDHKIFNSEDLSETESRKETEKSAKVLPEKQPATEPSPCKTKLSAKTEPKVAEVIKPKFEHKEVVVSSTGNSNVESTLSNVTSVKSDTKGISCKVSKAKSVSSQVKSEEVSMTVHSTANQVKSIRDQEVSSKINEVKIQSKIKGSEIQSTLSHSASDKSKETTSKEATVKSSQVQSVKSEAKEVSSIQSEVQSTSSKSTNSESKDQKVKSSSSQFKSEEVSSKVENVKMTSSQVKSQTEQTNKSEVKSFSSQVKYESLESKQVSTNKTEVKSFSSQAKSESSESKLVSSKVKEVQSFSSHTKSESKEFKQASLKVSEAKTETKAASQVTKFSSKSEEKCKSQATVEASLAATKDQVKVDSSAVTNQKIISHSDRLSTEIRQEKKSKEATSYLQQVKTNASSVNSTTQYSEEIAPNCAKSALQFATKSELKQEETVLKLNSSSTKQGGGSDDVKPKLEPCLKENSPLKTGSPKTKKAMTVTFKEQVQETQSSTQVTQTTERSSRSSTKTDGTQAQPRPRSRSRPKQELAPQPDAYTVPEGIVVKKVAGARSKKPTLANQWRKQKERQKLKDLQLADRIQSFAEWPSSDSPPINGLAEAGFFYLGLNDCVQCSSCDLVQSGWSSKDNPWIRHACNSPACSFLLEEKGSEWINECYADHANHDS